MTSPEWLEDTQMLMEFKEGMTIAEFNQWVMDNEIPSSAQIWLDKGRQDVHIFVEWFDD